MSVPNSNSTIMFNEFSLLRINLVDDGPMAPFVADFLAYRKYLRPELEIHLYSKRKFEDLRFVDAVHTIPELVDSFDCPVYVQFSDVKQGDKPGRATIECFPFEVDAALEISSNISVLSENCSRRKLKISSPERCADDFLNGLVQNLDNAELFRFLNDTNLSYRRRTRESQFALPYEALCSAWINAATITTSGKSVLCIHHQSVILGDVREGVEAIQKRILTKNRKCRKCRQAAFCFGGCLDSSDCNKPFWETVEQIFSRAKYVVEQN